MSINICNFEIKINKAGGIFPCNLILNFEKLEVPTFSSEDELIENFQQMYIYAFALGIEKRFLNFLDVTLEKNNFAGRKEFIYEKLLISTVFCDKKLLGELKLNVMGR